MTCKEFIDSLVKNKIVVGSGIENKNFNNDVIKEAKKNLNFNYISTIDINSALGILIGSELCSTGSALFFPTKYIRLLSSIITGNDIFYQIPLLFVSYELNNDNSISQREVIQIFDELNIYWTYPTIEKIDYACWQLVDSKLSSAIIIRNNELTL